MKSVNFCLSHTGIVAATVTRAVIAKASDSARRAIAKATRTAMAKASDSNFGGTRVTVAQANSEGRGNGGDIAQ